MFNYPFILSQPGLDLPGYNARHSRQCDIATEKQISHTDFYA